MEYQEFVQASRQVDLLLDSGRLKDAEAALYKLILGDISEIDRSMLCVQMAGIYDKLGKSGEAIAWYDKGIASEEPLCRFYAAEKKAEYLAWLGQANHAVELCEALLKQPFLSESDKDRMRGHIKTFLSKTLGEWR